MHAADAGADEGAAGEGHCQIFVVDAFSVAFEDLCHLGGGALPEFFEAFFEGFPGQFHQLVAQLRLEEVDQGLDDLLADFDEAGDRGGAEAGGQGEGDLDYLGEGRDDDVVLGGF
ncbi:hypothetical protein [Winogradskya consettensis]|uniref:hypothetical protein n=1 Tax=Winogradskya consettensis TaxID=113560 RepID=UPI0031DDC516